MTTEEPEDRVVPRGISHVLFLFGYFLLGFLGSLLNVFDQPEISRWACFLALLGVVLVLGRHAPAIMNWLKRKDSRGILVYSDSPAWKSYIEDRWLPVAGERLELINISRLDHWKPSLAGLIFEVHLEGKRPSLPVALVFSKRPALIAFNGGFLDFASGDDEQLKKQEQNLARALGVALG